MIMFNNKRELLHIARVVTFQFIQYALFYTYILYYGVYKRHGEESSEK